MTKRSSSLNGIFDYNFIRFYFCIIFSMRTFKIFALLFCGRSLIRNYFLTANPANFPVSELSQRQLRFRAMEQRALDLSERLSKMTGQNPLNSSIVMSLLLQYNWNQMLRTPTTNCQGRWLILCLFPEEPLKKKCPQFTSRRLFGLWHLQQATKGDYYFMPVLGFSLSSYI